MGVVVIPHVHVQSLAVVVMVKSDQSRHRVVHDRRAQEHRGNRRQQRGLLPGVEDELGDDGGDQDGAAHEGGHDLDVETALLVRRAVGMLVVREVGRGNCDLAHGRKSW